MNGSLDKSSIEVVLFEVAGQRFAVRSAQVRQIVRAATLSAAPRAHPAVKGILNLRGQVVAVVDLRRLLDVPDVPLEPTEHLIVAQAAGGLIALRADRAVDVVRVAPENVEPAGGVVRHWSAVEGVARLADGLALLLDADGLWEGGTTLPESGVLTAPPAEARS